MQAGQLVILTGKRLENQLTSSVLLHVTNGVLQLGQCQLIHIHLTHDSAYLDASQLSSSQRARLKLQYVHVQSDNLGVARSGLYLPRLQEGHLSLPEKVEIAGLTSRIGYHQAYSQKEVQYMVFINVLDIPRPTFSSLTYSDHNAVLIFPNERPHEKSIWINYTQMGDFTPYFVRLFESGFAESQNLLPSLKDCPSAISQDIANIAQECRNKASQRSSTLEDSHAEVEAMETDVGAFFDYESDLEEVQGIRYVVIEDTSYAVYRAVITWILTGKISFTTLPSRKGGIRQAAPIINVVGDPHYRILSETVPCSPVEIYKLAHKLEMPSLCQLALNDYEAQTDDSNVIKELFSYHAEIYPEIRERGMRVLQRWYRKVVAAGGLKEARKLASEGRIDTAKSPTMPMYSQASYSR